MNPSLFAAAIAAVFILGLRRGQTRGASTKPSPSPPEGEGSGEPPAPPKPRPRPGKDFAVGGFKSAGGGGGGGGGGAGGGIVFEPGGGGQDPEPEPEPEPFNAVPAFQHLPAPIEWEAKIGNVDDSHEVQLSEQEKKRLPDGEYYAKLSLDVRMTAPQIRDNGHGTWVWNNANIVWYGQIETITYRMIVSGDAAEAIVNLAEAENADIIIMATHGRQGLNRLLFGSVAEKVVKTSPVPVMTLRPE